MPDSIDWEALHTAAVACLPNSYSPYSKFPVEWRGSPMTAGSSAAPTSRTPPTASPCAPSARWCRISARPGVGGSSPPTAWTVGNSVDALRPMSALLWEFGGADMLLMTPEGC